MRTRLLFTMLSLSLGSTACGKKEAPKRADAPAKMAGPQAEPEPPAKPKTCFDDARWATAACAGEGQAPPSWWGASRWPQLKLVKQKTLKSVRGRTHWSLTLQRGPKLQDPKACVAHMESTLKPLFTKVEMLPSSTSDRASFRASATGLEITVVCGTSAGDKPLVNLDLSRTKS